MRYRETRIPARNRIDAYNIQYWTKRISTNRPGARCVSRVYIYIVESRSIAAPSSICRIFPVSRKRRYEERASWILADSLKYIASGVQNEWPARDEESFWSTTTFVRERGKRASSNRRKWRIRTKQVGERPRGGSSGLMVERRALTTELAARDIYVGAIWLSKGKTVLKMTLINFGKRPRWNLYSAYSEGRV